LSILLALFACALLVSSPALAKKKKRKKSRKGTHRPQAVKTGPNFLLHDWLFDVRQSTRSYSVGKANKGKVVNSQMIALAGRSWRFINSVRSRKTNYGTEGLVELLKRAGDTVAERFPGALVEIGNIGRRGGGRIPQSKSHQGGRDVDVAFLARDGKGRVKTAGRFHTFDATGKSEKGWTLDVERTWEFVKALLVSEDPVVQWIFVSSPIKRTLVEHARNSDEPGWLVRRAFSILHQPGDSASHADHMHIRVHCNDLDRANGCIDYGPARSHLARDNTMLNERIELLRRRAATGLLKERFDSIAKLQALDADSSMKALGGMLCDNDSKVVDKALKMLEKSRSEDFSDIVVGRLACARSPANELRLLSVVVDYRDRKLWRHARKLAKSPACLHPEKCRKEGCKTRERLCSRAVQALSYSGKLSDGRLIVPLLNSESKRLRKSALKALQRLCSTREPVLPGKGKRKRKSTKKEAPPAKLWSRLLRKFRKSSWADEVRWQLGRQGYEIGRKLYAATNVKELLRATKSGFPLSYSAQVVLASLYKVELKRPMDPKKAYKFFKKRAGRQANGKKTRKRLPPLPD